MKEEWKDINGFEGLYQVSNHGRVKSSGKTILRKMSDGSIRSRTPQEKIMILCDDRYGYKKVLLYKDQKRLNKTVHRLVADNFIIPVNGKNNINHKDGNKTNNHVSNLEWVTIGENNQHAYNLGLAVGPKPWLGKKGKNNPFSKMVIQLSLDGFFMMAFDSITEAFNLTGINNISACCRGVIKSAGGFKWSY